MILHFDTPSSTKTTWYHKKLLKFYSQQLLYDCISLHKEIWIMTDFPFLFFKKAVDFLSYVFLCALAFGSR